MIRQFRKVPTQLEAVEFKYDSRSIEFLKGWMGKSFGRCRKARCMDAVGELEVITLEDGKVLKATHIATEGDFIVKGVEGEFYPVKPHIFWKLYEEVV
ncbi:MAG: hypothetical protein EOM67_15055 [Spirochaetia bacterium]|nr:hypothetical protein [Spirochaetia bacterium]